MAASTYLLYGFASFVFAVIFLHCYFKFQERKRIKDNKNNIVSKVLSGINASGHVGMTRQYTIDSVSSYPGSWHETADSINNYPCERQDTIDTIESYSTGLSC